MKLRSKLLLSATCLLTISVAATATSAYAWFISNRQATVAINNATVKTNATNLKITGSITSGNGTAINPADNKSTTITSTVVATDISGDGKTFFKPRLSPEYNGTTIFNASKIEAVTSGQNYYHEFSLTFSQTNTNVNTGVFLSVDSTVLLTTAVQDKKDAGLSLCTRVAFLDNDSNLLLYWAPNRTSQTANQSYIYTNSFNGDTVSIKDGDTNSSVLKSVSDISKAIYGKPADVNDASLNKTTYKEHLLTLAGTTAQTITVRIWFEGMDSACDSKYLEQTIDANLKFNGVNMDI